MFSLHNIDYYALLLRSTKINSDQHVYELNTNCKGLKYYLKIITRIYELRQSVILEKDFKKIESINKGDRKQFYNTDCDAANVFKSFYLINKIPIQTYL